MYFSSLTKVDAYGSFVDLVGHVVVSVRLWNGCLVGCVL